VSANRKLPVYRDDGDRWRLVEAEALSTLARLPDSCVDAVITDPPYAIALSGETWDHFGGGEAFERWTSQWAKQALRLLKPGGHLLAFGAPRTFHRLVAGIEDAGLQVRDQVLWLYAQGLPKSHKLPGGRGSLLKPAYEPVLLARKPLQGKTIDNLERYGTGALNIDATRIGEARYWPAHLTLSHAQGCQDGVCATGCPVRSLDRQRENLSRLFFCAKAPRREREAGCEQLPAGLAELYTGSSRKPRVLRNIHPTVKPVELMRWLVRLVTPPGGVVLDPFTGSGSTGIAAVMEDRSFLGLEREPSYVDIACARLTHWAAITAQEEVLP
jgi:DNA modification methylase